MQRLIIVFIIITGLSLLGVGHLFAQEIEPNDKFATATPLLDNTEPSANFSSVSDVDIWKMEMREDSIYHIYSASPTADAFNSDIPGNVHVELYWGGDTTTNILNGSPDGRGLGNNFRIAGWVPAEYGAGTYYLKVNAQSIISGEYTGNYKIRFISQDLDFWANLHEPDNSFQEAFAQAGLPIDGVRFFGMFFQLDSLPTGKDDVDYFYMAGLQGKRLWVETEPVQGYPNTRDMDSKIYIYDADGTELLSENDDKSNQEEDFGSNNVFSLAVIDSLPYDGLYYVVMTSFYSEYNNETHSDSDPSTGGYVLYSWMGETKAEVEPNDAFAQATPICEAVTGAQIGGNNNIVIDANFSSDGDVDYYAFNLKSVKMYSFNTANSSVADGANIQLGVYSIDDEATNLIDTSVEGRYNSEDFRLSGWSPPEDGIYVLKVSPAAGSVVGDSTGDYQLRMGWATWRNGSRLGEPDNDTQFGAVAVEFDSSKTNSVIYPAADEDWYSFTGTAGDIIHVETFSGMDANATWGRDFDTKIMVVDPSGAIVENDDYRPGSERHPGNTFSAVTNYTLQGSGMVYVKVEGYYKTDADDGKNAVGAYRLLVYSSAASPAFLEREPNNTFAKAMQIPEGKDVVSSFSSVADSVDIFAIDMVGSDPNTRMYFVNSYEEVPDGDVENIHVELYAATDTLTNLLDSSIDGRYHGDNFRLSGFIPPADGIYYVRLSNHDIPNDYIIRARSAEVATVGGFHEPDNTIGDADARGEYPIDGVPMTGALYNENDPEFENDVDIFRFTCTAGQMFVGELTPAGGDTWDRDTDTYLQLVNAAGDTISANDDATGTYSTVAAVIPADGVYYLKAFGYYSAFNNGRDATHRNPGIGDYILTVKGTISESEPNNTAEEANAIPIANNNLIEASFSAEDLEDWFKVDLEMGKLYYFNTADSKVGDNIRVEVFAEGSGTNLIDTTPFGGFSSGDFRLSSWSPPTTGTYLLRLFVLPAAIDPLNTGEYKLRAAGGEVLSEIAALHEPDNSRTQADAQAALATDGVPVVVGFGDADDYDMFAINGVDGQSLEVVLAPAHGPRWIREIDTEMSLYTADSSSIANNDDWDDWYELEFYKGDISNTYSRVFIDSLPGTGTYYVDAYPYYGTHNGNTTSFGKSAVGTVHLWAKMTEPVTSIEKELIVPKAFALEQNYPNPFNPTTTINYSLKENVDVKLVIYNVMGQKIATLVDKKQAAGSYQLTWDSTNQFGMRVATGIYFYRLIAGDKFVKTNKMLLIK
jgi:hypothetical protein